MDGYTVNMISRYQHQGLTWIDLESPTRAEIEVLKEEFELHPVIAEELLLNSERAKVDIYDNAIYLILHFPFINRTTGRIQETEIDFVILNDVLITTHYELIDPLHDFSKLFEVGSYLSNLKIGEHAGFLFFSQIRELYKHTVYVMESVGHEIKEIESRIFAGEEAEMVERISRANRSLIDTRQTLRYHSETLKSLSYNCKKMFGEDFTYYVSAIQGEYEHCERTTEENRQTLRDLRETNDSLLSTKTNETIKRLTAVNIIMLPLGLVTWIFAMHSEYLSLNNLYALLTVLASMAIIAIVLVLYFRSKKWI
jgi:magnesium transporter